MINFDEEIKKFHPSLEIEEAEDAIAGHPRYRCPWLLDGI